MPNSSKPWTAAEDEIVEAAKPPYRTVMNQLPGRTFLAMKQRRYLLRHPEILTEPQNVGPPWTAREIKVLRSVWPYARHTREVKAKLPRFSLRQLRYKASKLHLRRAYTGGEHDTAHWDLVDQIRLRCSADGISFAALDKELKTNRYFSERCKARRLVNLRHVAKAVRYFGGTLIIDWQDR